MSERILYTDGHEVTVTDSFFKVRNSMYYLEGISKHSLFVIQPHRLTPLVILVLGVIMIALGGLHLLPSTLVPEIELYAMRIDTDVFSLATGGIFLVTGAVIMPMMKERYAIRIETDKGERNVVVSPKKEYVVKIEDALNHAFFNLVSSPGQQAKRR